MINIRFVEEKPYDGKLYTSNELDDSKLGCPSYLQAVEEIDPEKTPVAHCAHCGEKLGDFCTALTPDSETNVHTIFKLTYDIEAVVKHEGEYFRDLKIFNFLEYAENITKDDVEFRCHKCDAKHETIYVSKIANLVFIAFI